MKLCDCKCHAAGAKCDKCSATWAHECNQTNDFSVDARQRKDTVEVKTDVRPLPGKTEADMALESALSKKEWDNQRRPRPEDYGVPKARLRPEHITYPIYLSMEPTSVESLGAINFTLPTNITEQELEGVGLQVIAILKQHLERAKKLNEEECKLVGKY
jgi:hypothetical protein